MRKLTQEQVDIACLSYRHDFGLLEVPEQNRLRNQAQYWWEAFEKLGQFEEEITRLEKERD